MLLMLTIALVAAAAPDRAELKAKGGNVRFEYGGAGWQDAYEERITEGFVWRLSGGAPNEFKVKGLAVVFEDAVIFPGSYNVGAICRGEDDWELVFHNQGLNYNDGPNAGMTTMTMTRLEGDDLAKRLHVDLETDGAWRLLVVSFGPRRLERRFQTVPVKTIKGKVGKHSFTSTYLVRDDIEQMEKELEDYQLTIARLESKSVEYPVVVHLRGGDSVEVVLEREHPLKVDLFLDGESQPVEGEPAAEVEHSIRSGSEYAVMEFTVGGTDYSFQLSDRVFQSKKD